MTGPGISPYSWRETVGWPITWIHPSTRSPTELHARPAIHRFTPPAERAVRLLFVGDVMCMGADRVPVVSASLQRLVRSADLVVGNCEAPVTLTSARSGARYWFTFRMSEEYLRTFLFRLGVEPGRCVLSVANNHIGDQGDRGLRESVRRLRKIGVTPVGFRGRSTPTVREESAPTVRVEVGGLRIELTAWTRWLNREVFGAGEGVWRADEIKQSARPGATAPGIGPRDEFRIGLPHWDHEFHHFPSSTTRESARRLAGSCFDLLVGHHPHVLQPIEWLDGCVCLYSIGNLNGPTALLRSWPSTILGVLEVEIAATGESRGSITEYRLHRFVQLRDGESVRLAPLADVDARTRHRIEQRTRLIFPGTPGWNPA